MNESSLSKSHSNISWHTAQVQHCAETDCDYREMRDVCMVNGVYVRFLYGAVYLRLITHRHPASIPSSAFPSPGTLFLAYCPHIKPQPSHFIPRMCDKCRGKGIWVYFCYSRHAEPVEDVKYHMSPVLYT